VRASAIEKIISSNHQRACSEFAQARSSRKDAKTLSIFELDGGGRQQTAFDPRLGVLKGLGLAKGTSNIAGILVDAAPDLARWLL
jgi:hypothetical protein